MHKLLREYLRCLFRFPLQLPGRAAVRHGITRQVWSGAELSPRKSLSSLIRWTGISGDHTSKHMALVSNSVKILSLTHARQDMRQPQQSMPVTVSSLWRGKTCVPAVYKLEPALARLPCLWGADTGINYSLRHIQLSLLLFFFLESVEVLSKQEPRNKLQYI